ncbi:MAG: ATP-grasp domain-containing protein [Thiobacillus sp.]
MLLLLPAAGYANQDFQQAADKLGVEVITCADYCHQLAPDWGLPPLMSVAFDQSEISVRRILAALPPPPGEGANVMPKTIHAVIASDDHGIELAAHLREALGLPGNSVAAVMRLRDKLHFRELQQAHGLPYPLFAAIAHDDSGEASAAALGFPLVVKSRQLNASRGVIRADTLDEFKRTLAQVRRIQARYLREADTLGALIEHFIPGVEIALEGVLRGGELQVLALFDKPDPLDGPVFEESIYVTPSRLPESTQRDIADSVSRACATADITEGVVHAEARINDAGVWLLEIAPRAIGGLCGRILEATLGMGSAEIVLRHALSLPLNLKTSAGAAGVMMIPIPASGILQAVEGIEAARATPGITGIDITAAIAQIIAPPPEGASYLGFIFSRGDTPAAAEAALRAAHAKLSIHIQALI